jgi:phosphatidylserine/phosphatidylglycerophosphate/cardiolipin synthase-like enzyme
MTMAQTLHGGGRGREICAVATAADAKKWLLRFSSEPDVFGIAAGSGRPWGDETAMAAREGRGKPPWDEGCVVTPLIGGYETMSMMVEDLEKAIGQAPGLPEGKRGHVYIAGWRVDPLRDLSATNAWGTGPWTATQSAQVDQTAAGLILRMMSAGIQVRVIVWYPVSVTNFAGLGAHIDAHFYLARLVRVHCTRLSAADRGIVALDVRVAGPMSAAHHQKTIVIRVGTVNVAYCGGVDWAFTRRDAPSMSRPYQSDPADPSKPAPQFLGGDWQSGTGTPAFVNETNRTHRWPQDNGVDYTAVASVGVFGRPGPDLPDTVYGATNQIWHDQHLRLEGPIVATLEDQFRERWRESGAVHEIGATGGGLHVRDNQVVFSGASAIKDGEIAALPDAPSADAVAGGTSFVQMWRTIPLRNRSRGPFRRGEFTLMAGVSHACTQASELIWIFDQYFFSRALSRLLNHRVRNDASKRLCVIVVLPPQADDHPVDLHRLRRLSLEDLTRGLATATPGRFDRVAVFDLWEPSQNRGIYCHTKVQTYDRALLVCGSGNMNRRSFTCDTELDCAVLDEAVVDRHHQRLWKTLFPTIAWPALDFTQPGWGKAFFAAFLAAAAAPKANLIPDPWWDTTASYTAEGVDRVRIEVTPPKLPNGVKRDQDYAQDHLERARAKLNRRFDLDQVTFVGQTERPLTGGVVADLADPSSLRDDVETKVCAGKGAKDPGAAGRLDEIVYLIEGCTSGKDKFPWRRE